MADEQSNADRADELYRIRHSTAHIMAAAVLEMFPDAKLAIGPPIENGFYYDFDLPRPISTEDFGELEGRMIQLCKQDVPFESEEWSKDKARDFFSDQPYKLELIDGIEGDTVSIYKSGPLTDLCAGPHVDSSIACEHFKLEKVAGAYWRGDEDREMLQRIYGTAWKTKEQLDHYLTTLEEAKKRDHRKLGQELKLFHFHEHSPGNVFWKPRGWTAYRELESYFREIERDQGYEEIRNPSFYHEDLFDQSGHLEHYEESMFTMDVHGEKYCLKPMNCPDTMLYFGSEKRSYRELPLRVAEFGQLNRNERPGALGGATRVRQFCQDDAHIFCAQEHLFDEINLFLEMVDATYSLFDLEYELELSTRPEDFMGDLQMWNEAEDSLKRALEQADKPFTIDEGDGAFYGPKIDFNVLDCLGRDWQCATVQLDFQLPRRFDLTYTSADNDEETPIVIHRAIAGSLERFFAILVEHLAGVFPTWMAPTQARILPISDEQNDYAFDVADKLEEAGIRVKVDHRTEKVGKKIREAEKMKIPYMLVVGDREIDDGTVSVRTYREGRRGAMDVDELRDEIIDKIESRELDVDVALTDLSRPDDTGTVGKDMEERGY